MFLKPLLEMSLLGLSQISLFGLQFFQLKLLSTKLSSIEFGKLALFMTIVNTMSSVCFAGMSQTVLRFQNSVENSIERKEYLQKIKRIIFAKGSLIILFFFIWSYLFESPISSFDFMSIVGASFSMGILSILQTSMAVSGKKIFAAWTGVIELLLRLLGLVSFFIYLGLDTSSYALLASLFSPFFTILLILLKFKIFSNSSLSETGSHSEKELQSQIQKYYLSFSVLAILSPTAMFIDRWILSYFLGIVVVGSYSAIFQVANAMVMPVLTVMVQYLSPEIFKIKISEEHSLEKVDRLIIRTTIIFVLLMILILLCFQAYKVKILTMMTNQEIAQNHSILSIIFFGHVSFAVASLIFVRSQFLGNPMTNAYAWVIRLAIAFAITALLTPKLGIEGAAWGFLGGSIAFLIVVWAFAFEPGIKRSILKNRFYYGQN